MNPPSGQSTNEKLDNIGEMIGLVVGVIFPIVLVVIFLITGIIPLNFWSILGIVAVLIVLIFIGLMILGLKIEKKEKQKILIGGLPAIAKILEARKTGTSDTDNFEMSFRLEVKHSSLGKYQTETTAFIPKINFNDYVPGKVLNVKIDNMDKNKVALE
jgi:hypothetical protein